MFLSLNQVITDETGEMTTYPVLINLDKIESLYPSPENHNFTYIIMGTGNTILVNESHDTLVRKLDKKSESKSSGWIPCREFVPDIDDDYIVSIGKDAFLSYSVDVDTFKNGKWQNYGRKVVAWQPFPEHYEG
jgi:hypothetical protein